MSEEERQRILNTIMTHYDYFHQRDILVEECAELIQAVSKCKRGVTGSFDNFVEELADAQVMLTQMIDYVGREEVQKKIDEKLLRQIERIQNESNNIP